MFITKKRIPRRHFLRGTGVALALPLLDSMVSAQTPLSATAAAPKSRFMGIFFPHGMAPGYWVPKKVGADFDCPPNLEPLEPFRDHTVVLSGMYSKSAEPPPGVTGADHWVAAAFLCANKPKKTAGADIYDGTTIDQMIAQKIGQETLLPSIQLGIEDPTGNSSNCGQGYSCAYTNSIAWQDPTTPLPTEINPQVVFERLFGDGSNPAERIERRQQDRSILDAITGTLKTFKSGLGASDVARLDEYVSDVREIERRLQIAAKASTASDTSGVTVPAGVPESFDEHIKLQYDLNLLAWRGDITRVTTLQYARDLTSRVFPESGATVGWHGGSHHAEDPKKIAEYSKMNRYHVACLAYFLDKLAKTQDGDGTLLDHSLVLYGTNMGNSNMHLHYDVPHILVGGASGHLKGNRHLAYPSRTVPTGNLLLSVLDLYGIHQDHIGDSTGTLPNLV
jgi:hypothetical protein